MQLIKLTAESPRVSVGTRSLGKRRGVRLRNNNEEEGQSLVEFAVCLPMLLLIVTAIITFGLAFSQYLQMTSAVSISARLLAVSRGNTTDPCAVTATAFSHAAPFLNPANMTFAIVLNTPGKTYPGPSCNSPNTSTGAAGDMVQGTPAQVTATYPCNLSVFGVNYVPNCHLRVQTTELMQ